MATADIRRALLLGLLAQRGAVPQPGPPRPVAPGIGPPRAVAPNPASQYRRASFAHQQTAFDPQAQHGPISWGNQWFDTPEQVVAWMNARGAGTNINRFYRNHPGLAALFGQRPAQRSARTIDRRLPEPSLLARLTLSQQTPSLQRQVLRHQAAQYQPYRTATPSY